MFNTMRTKKWDIETVILNIQSLNIITSKRTHLGSGQDVKTLKRVLSKMS